MVILQGSNGLTIVSSNTTGGSIFFADNNNNDAGKILYDHGSNDLILYTNRTEKLRLDSSGNVVSALILQQKSFM